MKRVGLIGPPEREEIQRLAMRLEERGAEGVILDCRDDPVVELSSGREWACGLDLRGFVGFYVADLGIRSPIREGKDGSVDEEASKRAAASSRRHLAAWNALLVRLTARCRVVNPPHTYHLHALKAWEMHVYAGMDVPSPWTLATTDPGELLALPDAPGREWIAKGMVGGYGYTESFEPPASAEEAVVRLAQGPRLIQERVQGDNVRAYVLGEKVIGAAEVVPIEGDETDSRRGEVRVRRLTLPPEVERIAIRAAAIWGMTFAAVDFMREASGGRHLVLECNSAPFFLSFEQQTGFDVSSRLADHLLGRPR